MSVTSGGITINLILDAAAQAAPTSFKNGLQQAVAILASNITDQITVNINIDYSGTGGGAAAGPDSGYYESYSWVRSQLVNHASAGDTTFNNLPSGTSIQGQSNVAVWNAQLKLWGVIGANDTTTDDASAHFSSDINPNLLVGVALHELTHAMGRVPYGSAPDVFDFYRFTSPGVHLFEGDATARAAYFSLDNGATKLADYGQNSDPSDFLNTGVQGPNDPFNEYYTSTTIQGLTSVDLTQLDALGFHLAINSPTTIESYGLTSLVQVGKNYFLDPTVGGAGPELIYGGAAVVSGQFNPWTLIGAEQTATGYEIAFKQPGTNYFTIWNTDNAGNYLGNPTGIVLGTSSALENFESSFHQDLNGDGVIGVPVTVLESFGSTSLVQLGNNYYLDPVGGGTGPELKYGGAAVVSGQFNPWTLIGAEQTATGYEIAFKQPGTNYFTIWNTDNAGSYLGNPTGIVLGTSSALENFESSFHQDLNGDGVIGVPVAVLESFGSTSLVQLGNNYYLDPVGGGTGPELKYGGAAVVSGQFNPWTLIGAEQTATGYEIAFKQPGTNYFTIWNTDNAGNYLGNPTGIVLGTNSALENFESSFHQDLNGDGVIGVPVAVLESFGSTSLVQLGNNYYLDPVGGGTGPELKYGGAAVVSGQFNPWTLIGAEQTATGYEIAFKQPGTNYFTIWNTDNAGSYLGNPTGIVLGTSSALENFESSFHQDLNGDGVIGVPVAVESFGSTSLVQLGNNYYLDPVGGGTGPELKYGGAAVVSGQFNPWTLIGAEQTVTGYEIAFKQPGTKYFTIWNTDNAGNYLGNPTAIVVGTSSALENFESSFHQDLNGDGVIGVPTAVSPAISAADKFNFDKLATPAGATIANGRIVESDLIDVARAWSDSVRHDSVAFSSTPHAQHAQHTTGDVPNIHIADLHWGDFIILHWGDFIIR
ncbi:NF038122 family metalloprotease [Bradyrhizobium sp. DASA03120]|uniref:NF038122 family metalloprotease n=1 Tax=Bradyrhizobium sp. SMVTL-02 TaxID=3395917 RepID=UPI003F6EBE22